MKKYVDRENTPLKFHNFLKNVSLPIGLVYYSIMIIYNLVIYGIESIATLLIIDYAFMVAAIVLIIIALRGLSKWKYSAWKCTVGLFTMILIYNITYLAILTVLNLSGGDEVIDALRAIIIDPFVIVYYYKRKALFGEGKERSIKKVHVDDKDIVRDMDLPISKNTTLEETNTIIVEQEEMICYLNEKIKEKKSKVRFCKLCGGQIDSQTKKCSGCGKQHFKGIKFNKFSNATLVLSVVILISIILNIVQFVKIDSLNYSTKMLRYEISKLEKENYETVITFLNYGDYIVAVNDNSPKYHTRACEDFDESSFSLYSITAAEESEYYACSICKERKSSELLGKIAAQQELKKFDKWYKLTILDER